VTRGRLAAVSFALAGALAAAAAAAPAASTEISSNWAGYVVVGSGSTLDTASPAMAFTDVTGTWTQPAATCTPGQPASIATWVGIGGYDLNAPALEQTGTEADCDASGKASYYAWYELVPAGSVQLKLKIAPGDTITSTVLIDGTDVLVQIKDRTRRTTFTRHLRAPALDESSAEWVVEAPSLCSADGRFCRTVPLANFGSVTFRKIAATGNGAGGTLSGPGWQATPIQLVPASGRGRFFGGADAAAGTAGATPAPSPDGASFTVSWVANATASSP